MILKRVRCIGTSSHQRSLKTSSHLLQPTKTSGSGLKVGHISMFIEGSEARCQRSLPRMVGLHTCSEGNRFWWLNDIDPVFFVHHTQIDRLWWLWQQRDPETRNDEFFGPFGLDDSSVVVSGASLTDAIIMLGLAEDRVVSKLMKTESEILCYRYEIQKQAKITEMETTIVPDPLSPDRHRCLGQSRTSREG